MFCDLLKHEFSPYAKLSEDQLTALESHYRLLKEWNAKMNLTRIESLEDAVRFHYCESLFLGTLLPAGFLTIADVGSGPGFPGIPVAIFRPECSISLVESHQRKAVFLREASRSIPNVTVIGNRADAVGRRFDWVVSRAVDPREVLRLALAPHMALLVGRMDAKRLGAASVCSVPWGEDRAAAVFHVKHERVSST